MSEEQVAEAEAEASAGWQQEQAARYLTAAYGPDVIYRAPETFSNLVERWIWSVASGLPDFGETCMTAIEAHCAEREG